MPSTPLCRVFGDGRAQVDTASLVDMHGEAEKTEKQKARGYCVGADVDMLRQCKQNAGGYEASCDLSGV